jgi:hypothetical protein
MEDGEGHVLCEPEREEIDLDIGEGLVPASYSCSR